MYEYTPKYTRKKEILTVVTLLVLAAILIIVSKTAGAPFPALWQLAAFVLLTAMIFITIRFLLRSYTCRVFPREDEMGEGMDLTVIERVRKHAQTVCRVSVSDIVDAEWLKKENRRALAEKRKGKRAWFYYAELNASNLCQLTVRDGEDCFYLILQADERLFFLLKKQ